MMARQPHGRIGLAGVLALLYSAGCAYQNPVQPSVAGVDLSVPSAMAVSALPASGVQSGATIVARVQNANGVPLANVIVMFATTRGTVSPAQAATGVNGTASTTLSAADTADVTAAAGGISAHTLVAASSTPGTPTPTLPSAFLNVAAGATTGVPLAFSVSAPVAGATWNWSFGDGANTQTTAFNTTHTYAVAGTYMASVSSSLTSAGTATVTVTNPPPVTSAPAFVATMNCAAPVTRTVSCNVSATYNGQPVASTQISAGFDWGDQVTNDMGTPVRTHTYAQPGTFTVIATATYTPVGGTQQSSTTAKTVVVQ
jgi:hypothetical protein